MRMRSARIIPFPASPTRRRRQRFRPRRRPLFSSRRRRAFPFSAPILILGGAVAFWLAISPSTPALWSDFWSGLASVIATGEWPDRPAEIAAASSLPSASDGLIAGRATIIDADTIDIHGARIRLHAVDAPESSQLCYVGSDAVRCGQRAAMALDGWIAARSVRCIKRDVDRYGRIVATCTVGGEDMGAWLVRSGHAVAYRDYGSDYVCEEAEAAREKRGLWAMRFVEPSAWRRLSADEKRDVPTRSYDPGWSFGC